MLTFLFWVSLISIPATYIKTHVRGWTRLCRSKHRGGDEQHPKMRNHHRDALSSGCILPRSIFCSFGSISVVLPLCVSVLAISRALPFYPDLVLRGCTVAGKAAMCPPPCLMLFGLCLLPGSLCACLVLKKCHSSRHIESCDTCMEH